jgi:hypothetical protein
MLIDIVTIFGRARFSQSRNKQLVSRGLTFYNVSGSYQWSKGPTQASAMPLYHVAAVQVIWKS